jgi:hypothetical protein
MTRILLKKLTRKSIIDGGKNKGLTVQDVLNKSKSHLIFSYFNYSNITYTDDILDELRIKPEDRIQKPGKDPKKHQEYIKRNVDAVVLIKMQNEGKEFNMGEFVRRKKNILKAKAKAKYKSLIERERKQFSKGALQRRNHR